MQLKTSLNVAQVLLPVHFHQQLRVETAKKTDHISSFPQVQRQRNAAAQLLTTALPQADFMSQVCTHPQRAKQR